MGTINKILYVTHNDLSLANGPGVNETEFLGALSRRLGSNLTALLIKPANELLLHEGSDYQIISKSSLPKPFNHLVNQFHIFAALYKHLRRGSIDLVVFRIAFMPWFIFVLHKRFKFNYAVKTVGLGSENLKSLGGWRRVVSITLGGVDRFFTRYALQHAIALDACTSQLVTSIRDKYDIPAHKILHVENATNTERFKPLPTEAAKQKIGLARFTHLIGYIGGSPSSRGARELIQVIPRLVGTYPELGVLIVGYDSELDALKKQVAASEWADRVVFTDRVLYAEVAQYVSALDVGVAFDDLEKLKMTGNSNQKIRQYVSAGKPVIASFGGNDFIDEFKLGERVDHTDIQGIADSLDHWLQRNLQEAEAHSHFAHKFAQEHLSVDEALERRLRFWSEKLDSQ